jgi:hypothetical protein
VSGRILPPPWRWSWRLVRPDRRDQIWVGRVMVAREDNDDKVIATMRGQHAGCEQGQRGKREVVCGAGPHKYCIHGRGDTVKGAEAV